MTINQIVKAGGAALLVMVLVVAGFAAWRIDAIRMGGPLQMKAQQTSDLVADVLPPPAYVIEAYLEATLLLRDPSIEAQAAKRLSKLHDDYRTRLAYWSESGLDPQVYAALSLSKPAADSFWSDIETEFLPAAAANDRPRMERSYARLASDYAKHRRAIDGLVVRASKYQADLNESAASTLRWALVMLTVMGVTIISGVASFCAILLRRVVSPTVELSAVTAKLAQGEEATVPYQDRTDELGSIAIAVEQFRSAAAARAEVDRTRALEQRMVNDALAEVLETMAAGDLTKRVTAEFPPAFREVGDNLNGTVTTLRAMIQTVVETATEIEGGATQIATASEDLARRTEGTAASLEQTSAALVQIDQRLRAAAIASEDTVVCADSALGTVASGRSTAQEAVEAMSRVAESAKGTDAVIEGLDKIAFQTRVLAMNAAVEAGRAGDAGRGFAVVADLVSALAQRAEEEAKSARGQLTTTQSEIVHAVGAVERVDGALAEIAQNVGQVHQLLGGMVEDNKMQSLAVSEISAAVNSMDQATQQNAAMVEETSAAANNLSAKVMSMVRQAAAFKFERRSRDVPVGFDRRAGGRQGTSQWFTDPASGQRRERVAIDA